MKGSIITMERFDNRKPGSVGSSRIRGDWLVEYWDELEHLKIGKNYDFIIFQKAYWEDMVKEFKGIKIFDICDPDWLERRPFVEMCQSVDAIVTSTERLAEQIRMFDIGDKIVKCIPDRVNLKWSEPTKEIHNQEFKWVVWFGYSTSNKILDKVVNSLKKRNIKLAVISDQHYMYCDKFIKYEAQTVNREIIRYDAIVLPPYTNEDYRYQFKSNNKLIQSWALKMPVVLTAEDLDRFVDVKEREKEAKEKYEEVLKNWRIEKSVEEYKELIKEIQSKKK